MNFVNTILLFGAAAFVIPLIIHILNRSRFRTVHWGAMHLLDSIVRVNHRRFRIEQLILLLVRCAIPIVLAFCLARPLLTGWRDLAGDAPVSAVILLDTSYSMDAATAGGRHFDEAVQHAIDILKNMTRGSEVAVIQTGGRPTPVFDQPIFDPPLLAERLAELEGGFGASRMQESLELALATLNQMSHVRRELIVISDFQDTDWPPSTDAFYEQIAQSMDRSDIQPVATLVKVGQESAGNVSVEQVQVSSGAVGVGQEVLVRVRMHNYGSEAYGKARVALLLDGVENAVSQVDLEPLADTQAVFTCKFETPGSHVIAAELTVDDPLATDNRQSTALKVWEQVEVLLIDGAPSTQPLQGETDFLAAALTPFTLGRFRLTDLVVTERLAPNQLDAKSLEGKRVAVLANVSKLSAESLTAMDQFVRGGGGVMIFPGDKVDIQWYRQMFHADGAGLLPVPYLETLGSGTSEDPDAQASDAPGDRAVSHIVAQHFDHPALELFNDPANGDLSTAEIRRWFRLADVDDRTQVLARLTSGDPLWVQKRCGEGLVVQAATACDADWSDMPLRPVFVPLMQQLITSLAAQVTPPQNIATGEPIVAVFRGEFGDAPLSLTSPIGERATVPLKGESGRAVVRFEQTQRPGVYTLNGPDGKPIHFVAKTSRDESELLPAADEELQTLANSLSAVRLSSAAEYLQRDKDWRHGREIWVYVLAAVMALMFLELFLQQRFARARA